MIHPIHTHPYIYHPYIYIIHIHIIYIYIYISYHTLTSPRIRITAYSQVQALHVILPPPYMASHPILFISFFAQRFYGPFFILHIYIIHTIPYHMISYHTIPYPYPYPIPYPFHILFCPAILRTLFNAPHIIPPIPRPIYIIPYLCLSYYISSPTSLPPTILFSPPSAHYIASYYSIPVYKYPLHSLLLFYPSL